MPVIIGMEPHKRSATVEVITDLGEVVTLGKFGADKKTKAADKDLREMVIARRSTLLDLHGIGPSGVARLLADVGDI
ncbi:hypothetical protein M8542_10315 [Amycolatopsis sp. OK19-0408]|uniref:Uncharacterized protein n=1 Tax=Amycolatopsis iheyensis TaxID=2945988 RepID=A0A9X2NEP6_9PSEU|nr:hypothetical protein [Amycolatopsis iheyensis]MCR6483210.1 hypothetical protein [Amycolatopsis iheyensis]